MPYSGPNDSGLPSNVKKLSEKKRRQWVSVFNSTLRNCTGDDCEGKAFRVANGVVKKKASNLIAVKDSKSVLIQCECKEWNEVAIDIEKSTCGHCSRGMEFTWAAEKDDKDCYECEISYYKPYGGATSFEEVDAFREAQDTSIAVSSAKYMFDAIYDNIWEEKDISPDEKVVATEVAMKEMISRMQNPKEDHKGLGDKIKSLIGWRKGSKDEHPRESLLSITKDKNGDLRWLAIFTNKFEDREKEIFSVESHKEYEAWVDENHRFPSLRVWHLPGTELGIADNVTYADGFMLATGTFYEESLDVAEKLMSMKDLGLSHGFIYSSEDLSDGVYKRYRTFEISVLPMEHVANTWTAFTMESLQKEVAMGLNTKKRPFFVDLLGEERVVALEATLPQISKDLEGAGVGWKDLEEALASDESKGDNGEGNEGSGKGDAAGDGEADGDGKASDDNGDGKGDEVGKGDAVAVGVADAGKALEGLKTLLEPITSAIQDINKEITDLKKTDDEKIAAHMQQANVANGKRPTDSDGNIIDGDKTKDLEQAGENQNVGGQTNAARAIVDELLLGKKPVASQ